MADVDSIRGEHESLVIGIDRNSLACGDPLCRFYGIDLMSGQETRDDLNELYVAIEREFLIFTLADAERSVT